MKWSITMPLLWLGFRHRIFTFGTPQNTPQNNVQNNSTSDPSGTCFTQLKMHLEQLLPVAGPVLDLICTCTGALHQICLGFTLRRFWISAGLYWSGTGTRVNWYWHCYPKIPLDSSCSLASPGFPQHLGPRLLKNPGLSRPPAAPLAT